MKIKKAEAVCFTVNFIAAKLFISAPGAFINIGKNAAWIAVLLNAAAAYLSFLFIYWLYKKNKKREIFSFLPPFLKKTVGITVSFYLIISAGIGLALLIRGVIRTFMPETPSFIISLLFLSATLYAAKKGLIANVRLSVLAFPLLLIIPFVALALTPHIEPTNFFPILGDGNFFLRSLFGFNFFADFFVFYLLIPYFENEKDIFKTGSMIIGISTALCLLVVVSSTLTIPYQANFVSHFYQMLTFMAGSNSVINIIKVFKLVFLINFFLYVSGAAAAASYTLGETFDLKYPESTVFILSLFIIMTEEISYKTLTGPEAYERFMSWGHITFPLIVALSYLFGRRGKNEKNISSGSGSFNAL